jgi:TetR/AcrR family transcriptional regulator
MDGSGKATPQRRTAQANSARKLLGEETRLRILDAAARQFARKGFDGTALRDVARAAGVPHTAISYHFQTKDELWRGAVALMFSRLRSEVGGITSADGPEGYRQFIRRYVRYCARHPEHAQLMVYEAMRGGERLAWATERFLMPGHRYFGPVSAARMGDGDLPPVWPWSMAYIVAAMCQAPFLRGAEFRATTGLDSNDDAVIETHANAVIAILFADHDLGSAAAWPETPDWMQLPGSET